jgi:hypothetical protein
VRVGWAGLVGLVLCWDVFRMVDRQELLVHGVDWSIACDIVTCVAVCLMAFLVGVEVRGGGDGDVDAK